MNLSITNVYVRTTAQFSALVVEAIRPFNYSIIKITDKNYEIILDGSLIMAPDTIYVFDGLINSITVTEKNNQAVFSVSLEYQCAYRVKLEGHMPARLIIFFDRSFLRSLLNNKVIVIDPGHGGKDLGHRGYINLLEKDVVMDVARFMKQELTQYGAYAIMTREKDISLNLRDRINIAALLEAHMMISIHTHWSNVKAVNGARGIYYGEPSRELCQLILKEIEKKPGLRNLGAKQAENLSAVFKDHYINKIPYVKIKVCTISNPVEEGWLRSPVFKKRLANAITNGISAYLFQNNNIDI